jgi:hypothetical protein
MRALMVGATGKFASGVAGTKKARCRKSLAHWRFARQIIAGCDGGVALGGASLRGCD